MDGRIEAGFRIQLQRLLRWAGRPDVEDEAGRLLDRARTQAEGFDTARSLARVWTEVRTQVASAKRPGVKRDEAEEPSWQPPWLRFDAAQPPRFLCDPSLLGLGRWLRAAGYEAFDDASVSGHRLPDEALERGLVLLTSEAEVLERRIVATGALVVAWVPSALTMREQLALVMGDFALELREARCMACGGRLVPRDKEAVRPRIPPRTALWKDEYYVCAGCDRLFWQGTHWERIAPTLAAAARHA
jgi:uncharacterized protein with PIN domain